MPPSRSSHWIALHWPPEALANGDDPPSADDSRRVAFSPEALGWWALTFTPRVAWVDEALLLETSASLRLWGGPRALLARLRQDEPSGGALQLASAPTGLTALARLRLRRAGRALPACCPADLPLDTLSAARPHLPLLTRLGLRTWGELHALPRAPLVRRFGAGLRAALDIAWGQAPERHLWLTAPERFQQSLELPAHVDTAPALLWAARRLLAALRLWLRARQQGVLAVELGWTLDLKRLNGRELPPEQSLVVRTAEPTQSIEHLTRLLAERLAHTPMLAPATWLRLRAVETQPWESPSASLLQGAQRDGEPLHVFVERVAARLGPDSLRQPHAHADHRPEQQQTWQPAQPRAVAPPPSPDWPDALAPTWLLREPRPLAVRAGQPCHDGTPLRLLTRPRRIEAGWWSGALPGHAGQAAARDYFIAQGARRQLLWVYRERPSSAHAATAPPRWFLQGLYA